MALTQKEISKRFYTRRKEQGLCLVCGNALDRKGVRCVKCNEQASIEQRETRKWYQQAKICPRCRKNGLFGDEKNCLECSAKSYIQTMKHKEKMGREEYNKRHNEYSRKSHQKAIEEGICTRCKKRKADNGYKTCGICREYDRKGKMRRYGKPNRQDRYKQGLCYFCDEPIKQGYKVCEKHYQMNVEKSRKQNRDNHCWKN